MSFSHVRRGERLRDSVREVRKTICETRSLSKSSNIQANNVCVVIQRTCIQWVGSDAHSEATKRKRIIRRPYVVVLPRTIGGAAGSQNKRHFDWNVSDFVFDFGAGKHNACGWPVGRAGM